MAKKNSAPVKKGKTTTPMTTSSRAEVRAAKKAAFLEALKEYNGNVSATTDALPDIGKRTIYDWMAADPEFKAAVHASQQVGISRIVDRAEQQLDNLIAKGNTAAVIYALKSQGKNKGWSEAAQVDITSGGQSIVPTEVQVNLISAKKE